MKNLLVALLAMVSIAIAADAEWSVCRTEQLLPIGFTEEELTRIHEIGTYREPTSPPPSGVRNPAEFEAATGVMVRYPLGVPYDFLIDVSNNSYLWIIVSSSQQPSAQSDLAAAGVNMGNTGFIVAATNSVWVRDYGPWFIILPDGTQGIFDFSYNRPRPLDDALPQEIGDAWGIPVYASELIHTGGNYMSGGMGEAMSTDLVYTEDPHSQSWVDQQMEDYLGINPYTTFPDPQASYIDHIDCWAKMLSPDRIMVLQVPPSHGDYAALEAVASQIAASQSPYGTPWKVYRVFSSGTEGYVNGLLHNDTYYMPVWNTGNDSAAEIAFSEALPGYTVKTVYYSQFQNTDALHCRTRNVMDRYMLELLHTPVDSQQSTSPVSVTAFIRPDPANTLTSASLFYRTDSDAFTELSMTSSGGSNYTAQIPGQSNGTVVDYYIRAEDSSGRVSAHPRYAPATWFNSYTVSSAGIEGESYRGFTPPEMLSSNPFNSAMVYRGEPGTSFRVYDSAGRLVHSGEADDSGIMEWIPASSFADGIYHAVFESLSGYGSIKAVLLH